MTEPVIQVQQLSLDYRIRRAWLNAIRDVDLQINPLQIHGLVGESGSGKSTLALAMMRFLPRNARLTNGRILFGEQDLRTASTGEIERIWGAHIALVPQSPMDSLNPSLRISRQMTELTRLHLGFSATDAVSRATEALRQVQIADPERVLVRYPHQLSGGMLQRVMIAMALSTRPRLIVLDEPTTALDVTTQAVILDLLRDLIKEEEAAGLYVSHDLATVAQLCDYVTVLYAGEVMESAPVEELFATPLHPYTAGLLASLPRSEASSESRLATIAGVAPSLAERSSACVFADRCPLVIEGCRTDKPALTAASEVRAVRCRRWDEIASGSVRAFEASAASAKAVAPRTVSVLQAEGMAKRFGETNLFAEIAGRKPEYVRALNDVAITVKERSTFGLVGESGSGKTTLARVLLALTEGDSGEIRLQGSPVSLRLADRSRDVLQNLRIVFQNPDDSLNPYRSVGQTIGRTIQKLAYERYSKQSLRKRVDELLEAVGLAPDYYDRRPANLSGGEKQRVTIARAFAPRPALIVADEPTSSLDVSVQAVILNLLKDLRTREGASYVVISHDLDVVGYLADYIAVMYLGEIVEQGSREAVLSLPQHPYTEALLSAAPIPDPSVRHHPIPLEGEVPSPRHRPSGCPFHTRCPRRIGPICEDAPPPVRTSEAGLQIRCHYAADELRALQQKGPPMRATRSPGEDGS